MPPSTFPRVLIVSCVIGIFAAGVPVFGQENAVPKMVPGRTEAPIWTGDGFKVDLPASGRIIDGRPVGKGWVNLLENPEAWNADSNHWTFSNGELSGELENSERHNHAWTKKKYRNFELNAVFRMSGHEANSGICFRLNPEDEDNAPGYQADMGPGYWGCLWEERRAGMVQTFSAEDAEKLVNADGWNHYYVIANGHHIQGWLNGVKTFDVVHEEGFEEGSFGLQLCHGEKHTKLDVKTLFVREL